MASPTAIASPSGFQMGPSWCELQPGDLDKDKYILALDEKEDEIHPLPKCNYLDERLMI